MFGETRARVQLYMDVMCMQVCEMKEDGMGCKCMRCTRACGMCAAASYCLTRIRKLPTNAWTWHVQRHDALSHSPNMNTYDMRHRSHTATIHPHSHTNRIIHPIARYTGPYRIMWEMCALGRGRVRMSWGQLEYGWCRCVDREMTCGARGTGGYCRHVSACVSTSHHHIHTHMHRRRHMYTYMYI